MFNYDFNVFRNKQKKNKELKVQSYCSQWGWIQIGNREKVLSDETGFDPKRSEINIKIQGRSQWIFKIVTEIIESQFIELRNITDS